MQKRRMKIFFKILSALMIGIMAFAFGGCDILQGLGSSSDTFRLSKTELRLEVGESVTLTTNSESEVLWISEDESVATVEDGEVTGIRVGRTNIIAVSDNLQAECSVTVTGDVDISLSVETAIIAVGYSVRLTATTSDDARVTWISSDASVAAVANGLVTGISEGSAEITAAAGENSATCLVTVGNDGSALREGYALVWQDEFDGDSLNPDNWSYQLGTQDHYGNSTGPANWGNNELQSYQEENVRVQDGTLVITAQKEEEKVDGKSYTSGRITTRGKFSRTYGYIEARIKAPKGDGMWPAFWMLPQPSTSENSHNEYGGWARNGELDIMEAKGRLLNRVDTTLHFGGNYPQNVAKGTTTVLSSDIDEWHTYAVDWRVDYIAWIIDGKEVFRLTNSQWWSAAVSSEENPYAPFDKPFFILLNLAVGGTYDPVGTENFKTRDDFTSASMYVDYVRVYVPDI